MGEWLIQHHWERLKAGEEGDNRWDSWMASPTQWTWVWASSRSWWRRGRPGVLHSMGLQRVGHHWATELINGLPRWLSGKESVCQCRRYGFDSWVGKIPWRRAWQLTLVFLPGESQGQRSPMGYSPWGSQRVGHDWAINNINFHIYLQTWITLLYTWN